MSEKISLSRAMTTAQALSAEHPGVTYWVMDKPGKRTIVTGSAWVHRSLILEHWHTHCRFCDGKRQ